MQDPHVTMMHFERPFDFAACSLQAKPLNRMQSVQKAQLQACTKVKIETQSCVASADLSSFFHFHFVFESQFGSEGSADASKWGEHPKEIRISSNYVQFI